ncbi:putative u4 u6 small nuclear ribonucleoprotein prp4 [Diaporthe ampelina]|uniref:Putative u4 u6 small nuclear ribonucleoprotein prp4 n=1 Tax=Diaporthe ampelina TaxID=1214573 RepID=A0A0G2HUB0_9PEZI|nr:putative u4 u6 small nuclear ribonucleoprotein prp4 [Diaporthe ampelina]
MMHPSRKAFVEDHPMDEDRGGLTLDQVPNDYNYDLGTGENASALLSQFERKRMAARLAVPTNDEAIKAMLRERGLPITLFGENNPADRRERLRETLADEAERAKAQGQDAVDVEMDDAAEEEDDEEQEEEYYTRGNDELLQSRVEIAKYSLLRAKRRVQFQRQEAKIPLRTHVKHRKQIREQLQDFELQSSQVGGQRYLSVPGGPKVNKIGFHPSGRYLATACEDTTWKLYDIATGSELLSQEGHSRAVMTVSFQSEGALVATAGMDSIGRVWDLRSGRTIMLCEGHIQPITSSSWIDGHRILSASLDGFVKVWDVRKVAQGGNLAGNTSGVTDVRVFRGPDDPVEGEAPGQDEKGAQIPKKSATFFATCGFDRKINVYSMDDYSLISSLESHTAPVSSVDISRDGRWIVSGSHDRTIKLWARNEMEPL